MVCCVSSQQTPSDNRVFAAPTAIHCTAKMRNSWNRKLVQPWSGHVPKNARSVAPFYDVLLVYNTLWWCSIRWRMRSSKCHPSKGKKGARELTLYSTSIWYGHGTTRAFHCMSIDHSRPRFSNPLNLWLPRFTTSWQTPKTYSEYTSMHRATTVVLR